MGNRDKRGREKRKPKALREVQATTVDLVSQAKSDVRKIALLPRQSGTNDVLLLPSTGPRTPLILFALYSYRHGNQSASFQTRRLWTGGTR
jgi:hypothetical protein